MLSMDAGGGGVDGGVDGVGEVFANEYDGLKGLKDGGGAGLTTDGDAGLAMHGDEQEDVKGQEHAPRGYRDFGADAAQREEATDRSVGVHVASEW